MNSKKIGIVLAVFIVVFFVSRIVQSRFMNGGDLSSNLPPTQIELDDELYNFGNIPELKPVKAYFSYTNSGENPLRISNVVSPCGCTVPKWSKKELLPGVTDSLLVQFDAAQLGSFSKSLHIFSNAEGSPHVFYIRGLVE